jgi:hypothetical protein
MKTGPSDDQDQDAKKDIPERGGKSDKVRGRRLGKYD